MSNGSVEPLKKLHKRWGSQVQFLDVLIRQAHPGPDVPPYTNLEQKMNDARRYKKDEAIPWPVLVDDLEGQVHQVYGGLADPTYLIDIDGMVSYYNLWTYAPNLHKAIDTLMRQGGRGVVSGGIDRLPHLSTTLARGWRGLRRGLPQSYIDLELAAPGMGTALWLGYQLRGLLSPVVLRSRPVPKAARMGVLVGLGALAVSGMLLARRR